MTTAKKQLCQNRVIHLRRTRQFICSRPATELVDGKWRCKRHAYETKKRLAAREQVRAETGL